MRSRGAFVVVAAAGLVAFPAPARANVGKAILDGERYGGLVPDGKTEVRVDGETLSFMLAGDLASAAVTATYQLRHTGLEPESADLAFAFTRGDRGDDDPGARASVEVDGARLPLRSMRDVDLLGPRLHGWLDEHADVDRALHALPAKDDEGGPGDRAALRALVEKAGGRCDDGACRRLVRWYRSVNGEEEQHLAAGAEEDALLGAVHEAIPGATAELADRWSTLAGRADVRLGFLLFHVEFAPGQAHTVVVRYQQHAEEDRGSHVSSTYGFDYLLSPARRWKSFGPLDVTVHVSSRARFTSTPSLQRDGETWRGTFPSLPPGELRFEVRSLDRLWLGMDDPSSYRALAAALVAAVAIAVGAAAGRVFVGASRWTRLLLPLVTGAPLAAVCSLAVMVLLLIGFPHHALGFGYGSLATGAVLVLLSAPVGAAAAAATAAWRARRATGDAGRTCATDQDPGAFPGSN